MPDVVLGHPVDGLLWNFDTEKTSWTSSFAFYRSEPKITKPKWKTKDHHGKNCFLILGIKILTLLYGVHAVSLSRLKTAQIKSWQKHLYLVANKLYASTTFPLLFVILTMALLTAAFSYTIPINDGVTHRGVLLRNINDGVMHLPRHSFTQY